MAIRNSCAKGKQVGIALQPERIVIGSSSEKAAENRPTPYRPERALHHHRHAKRRVIKYASNRVLATKDYFHQPVANLAKRHQADSAKWQKEWRGLADLATTFWVQDWAMAVPASQRLERLLHASRKLGVDNVDF